MRHLLIVGLLVSACWTAAAQAADAAKIVHYARSSSAWRTSESANFVLHVAGGEAKRTRVLEKCEALRAEIVARWCNCPPEDWKVKCHVVLHESQATYSQAVGPGAAQTNGSTFLQFDKRDKTKITFRRIDLLASRPGQELSALPHELTHVVLAECFAGYQPPRWVDEGLAVLADAQEKQARHLRDVRHACAQGKQFRAIELLTLNDYPRPDRIPAFYGQSLMLAKLLTERGAPHKLLEFIERSRTIGHDRALREIYDIDGVVELERLWNQHHELLALN